MAAHVVPVKHYIGVFLALLVLTAITSVVAFFDLGALNNIVMLSIAVLKASLVVLIFMNVRSGTKLTKFVVVTGFFWVGIMMILTLQDYFTRIPQPINPMTH